MRELIYDNVRIQFLSEEVLRLEVRYGHISRIGIRFGFRTGERLKRQERDCRKVKADPGKIRAGSKAWW